jgi:hypothetical protein
MKDEVIPWGNIYNYDESGFDIGMKRAIRVIINISLKKIYQVETD